MVMIRDKFLRIFLGELCREYENGQSLKKKEHSIDRTVCIQEQEKQANENRQVNWIDNTCMDSYVTDLNARHTI